MNLLQVLTLGLLGGEKTRFVESAGATIDADEEDWRRLTGDGNRDLAPLTQDRMQRLAHFQWESNLVANRLIELPVAYLLSQGVSWRVDDDKAQRALNRHWADGINAWDMKLPKRVRELALFGEQCYPVFRDVHNGFVRLGYLDPALIETVVTDPENCEQPIGIVTKRNTKGVARRYRVIVNVPETAFAARTQEIRNTFTDGDCFYFRVNDLSSATRGRSDLLAQIDWLDAYDTFLFGEVDRAAAARAFIWDVELAGASPEEVAARARTITAPRSNSVRVHNDQEKWSAVAPQLNSYDASNNARLIRNHMLGGATVPEHWYGGAADVNRATGDSMAEPTEKMLEMRQRVIGYMLEQIGQYVVRSGWRTLDRELSDAQQEILATLRVEWPQMTNKDTTKYAAALQQVTSSVAQSIAEGLMTRETALRLIAAIAERLGVEIDPDEELAAAQAEWLGDDAFRPPADPADDAE
ncbi:MAG TPA: hypothetical protein PKZ76_03360 [Xanthomonadaceae bacterium]|nr:hypothetical protein [Xanthomonadaceae bacterium]